MLEPDLLAFLKASVRSTWALELLLLVRQQQPRVLSADQLALELRATPSLMTTCIGQLQAAGLVACEANGGCRYAPASPALDQLSEQLARAYHERPIAVINAIVSTPSDRLRNFADAFRFTKKDD